MILKAPDLDTDADSVVCLLMHVLIRSGPKQRRAQTAFNRDVLRKSFSFVLSKETKGTWAVYLVLTSCLQTP